MDSPQCQLFLIRKGAIQKVLDDYPDALGIDLLFPFCFAEHQSVALAISMKVHEVDNHDAASSKGPAIVFAQPGLAV